MLHLKRCLFESPGSRSNTRKHRSGVLACSSNNRENWSIVDKVNLRYGYPYFCPVVLFDAMPVSLEVGFAHRSDS